MKKLKEEDAEAYASHFSEYVKANIKADDIPNLWGKVHKAIRANPATQLTTKHKPTGPTKKFHRTPLSYAQRKDRIRQKLASKSRQQATQ